MSQHVFIRCFISTFMLIGMFGNLNVIFAICRKRSVRSKNVMFILFLSIAHLVCNISELVGLAMQHRYTPMSRRKCLEYNFFYFFFVILQSSLYLTIALDLCFSIVVPLRHMLWNKSRYVSIMLIFPFCFSVLCNVLGMYKLTDEVAPYCIFILALDPFVYRSIASLSVICNTITLIIISIAVFEAIKKSRKMRVNRHSTSSKTKNIKEDKTKVFRATFFMVLIYMISWVFATILFKIIISVTDEENTAELLPYMMVIVVPNYCQIYFVAWFRSPKLQKAFKEQLHWMTCGKMYATIFEKVISRTMTAPTSKNNKELNNPEEQDICECFV